MVEKTLFEQFDDRYNHLTHEGTDFREDTEVLRLVGELNLVPQQEFDRKRAATISCITRFINILRQSGDNVSKAQSTLHDNRLKSLMLQDIIFCAKTGSVAESQVMVYQNDGSPEDHINSAVLQQYLQAWSTKILHVGNLGDLYFLIHDKCKEFLDLEI